MKLSKKSKSNIALVIGIVIMLVLFLSSSTKYEDQSTVPFLEYMLSSKPFHKELECFSFSYGGQIISIQQNGYFKFVEFFIRKGAHFLSYFIMGFSYIYSFHYKMKNKIKATAVTFFICACYAIFDEFHQSLTPSRTPLLEDVILDISGSATSILLFKIKLLLKI